MNPIRALRARRGMTRAELAQALGVSYTAVTYAELGLTARLSRPIVQGLAQLGEDAEALARAYVEWRSAQGKEVAAR